MKPVELIDRLLPLRGNGEGEIDIQAPVPKVGYTVGSVFSKYFKTEIIGAEHIPTNGGTLLIGNHALAGVDSLALLPELVRRTGRVPRGLALESLFDVPILKKFLYECGMVAGSRESACELLDRGELCIAYPGGSRDSLKGRSQKYKLMWGERRGFAHVAIRSGASVVPIAAIGPDDAFPLQSRRGHLAADWLGGYKIPLFVPVARRVPFTFHVGEPLAPPDVPHEATTDEFNEAARGFASSVQQSLEGLIEQGLRLRG